MKKPVSKLEKWEWIEEYWTGKLSSTGKEIFEKTMEEDPDFKQEANELKKGIRMIENVRLEYKLRQHLKKLNQRDRAKHLIIKRILIFGSSLVAASIVFVIYLSYATVMLPSQENDLEVVRDLRDTYQNDSTQSLSIDRKKVFDAFYEGQVYLTEGRPELAAQRFEKVLTFENLRPYFLEATQWHLVLCYIKTNQIERASFYYKKVENSREYDIKMVDRWKVWWQIQRAQL